jgi:hypothetical protein
MVVVHKTVKSGIVLTVRTGWDSKSLSTKEKTNIENWGYEFENEFYRFCDHLNIDPDLIDVTVDDCMSYVGDPKVEARKHVRKQLKLLRLI